MNGIKFNFDTNDLTVGSNGSFDTAVIDNQNVALISLSQVCRLTKPEVGAQIGSRLINIRRSAASAILLDAKKQAENDGAKNVRIQFTSERNLIFTGTYEN